MQASLEARTIFFDGQVVEAISSGVRQIVIRTAEAEPWLTILPAQAQAALLARAGWRVTASVDAADLGTGAAPGRSLLVTAVPVLARGDSPEPPVAS